MRVVVSIGLLLIALACSAVITAQTRNKEPDKEKDGGAPPVVQDKKPEAPTPVLTSRAILARLQLEIETERFREGMKFKTFLENLSDHLQTRDKALTFNLDVEAFADGSPDQPSPFESEVSYKGNRKRAPIIDLLNLAVKQLGTKPGAIVIRAGRVDILPITQTTKEYLFNQTFRADFKDQRLEVALEDLSDLTGVSIVIDPRVKEKIKTTVTARFNDDVAMQDAVRMLTDMADLKIVYLVTGMYVTTPEHAKVMQKELKDLYEPTTPIFPFGLPLGPMMMPQMGEPPAPPSPLAPPLPPPGFRGRRLEAAA